MDIAQTDSGLRGRALVFRHGVFHVKPPREHPPRRLVRDTRWRRGLVLRGPKRRCKRRDDRRAMPALGDKA